MSGELTFVDTNILVYAYDEDAGSKHERARETLIDLWDDGVGTLSVQVLQEFYVTVTRKLRKPVTKSLAREVLTTYQTWPVHSPTVEDVKRASELEERHKIAFWDALIIVAALATGATTLLSEDLPAGRTIAGLKIVNPLA